MTRCPFIKESFSYEQLRRTKECLGAKSEAVYKNYCTDSYDNCRVYKIRLQNLEEEQRRDLGVLRLDDIDNMEEFDEGEMF